MSPCHTPSFSDDCVAAAYGCTDSDLRSWGSFSIPTPSIVRSTSTGYWHFRFPVDVVVYRDGIQTSLPAASLVPGGIVHLVMGQKVPADIKLIDIFGDLRFDRCVLTGEVFHDAHAYAAHF